ncbi:PsiE family protein, partial [Pseudomonas amygdali pv. mori str. 301020]
CGGILLLAFAILVVRYASYKYPSAKIPDSSSAVKGAVTEEKGEI